MPNLVGIGLSQVPTNSMLGGLAYQDPEHASIKDLDLKNLSQINSEIADTATDIFIYDTSKDSDGGAWRKRTSHTSWYNETLGTATRGTRKEFPAVAVIVVETTQVTIYDGDDPDLSMWMVFNQTGGSDGQNRILNRHMGNLKSVSMLNGNLTIFGNSTSSADRGGGVWINFISEFGYAFGTNDSQGENIYGTLLHNIAQRNTILGTDLYGDKVQRYQLVDNSQCNDVAMTVLPNAPIDSATGLPIPTIAVATNGGVSVIKGDGSVINATGSGVYAFSKAITITEENYLWWLGDSYLTNDVLRDSWLVSLDNFPSSDFTWNSSTDNMSAGSYYAVTTNGEQGEIRIGPVNTWAWNKQERNALGGPAGLAIHKPNIGSENNSLIAAITSDYNTGWMHGDIKGAFLSDTTNATELITNGTFDSNTSGWTAYHSVISVDSNRLRVDDTANAGGWSSAVYEVATVIGKTYQFTFTYTSSSNSFLAGHYAGSYASAGAGTQPTSFTDYGTTSGTYIRIITATTTTTSLVLSVNNDGVSFVDNVSFKLAEADRSVNNNSLTVYGTITKTPVATGAELVAYSGFSASNYLTSVQTAINFGSSPNATICFISWVNQSTTGEYSYIISAQDGTSTAPVGMAAHTSTGNFYVYEGTDVKSSSYDIVDGTWHHCVGIINGTSILGYVDGKKVIDTSTSNPPNLSGIDRFNVGHFRTGTSNLYHQRGSLALSRVTKSIPSAEQVKKMYEDEKVLFQENAKATLYGSSNAVTALAYDEGTDQYHVGTSAGRSDFQGLRRINNTTTAVTTAISAHDGFIVEQ